MKTVVLIGDSIRIGYQDTVREELEGTAQVWAPSENGENSRNVLAHLDEWVISRSPDLVHLNCGLHDLKREFCATETAVSPQEYEKNLRTILGRIVKETNVTVIWASTTPVDEALHHANKGFDRLEADVVCFNGIAAGVVGEMKIPGDDLFAVINEAGRDRLLQEDGVHFTSEGYHLLGGTVAGVIRHALKG